MEDSKITGAPAPLMIGDTEYRASPLSDKDHSELDLWCQARIVRIARASVEGEDEETKQETMRFAFKEASTIRWSTDWGSSMFETKDGMSKLAWQLIYKNHPDTTVEQLRAKIKPENLQDIMNTFKMLHTTPSDNGDGESDAAKN